MMLGLGGEGVVSPRMHGLGCGDLSTRILSPGGSTLKHPVFPKIPLFLCFNSKKSRRGGRDTSILISNLWLGCGENVDFNVLWSITMS